MSESVGNEESYVTKEDQVPVVDDNDNVEEGVDEATADSDAQLGESHFRCTFAAGVDCADPTSRAR